MTHHDLIVIGTGSGNRVIDDSFADLDVAIVEQEQRFGGTCLNVGCIPTKMLAYTGEVVDTVTARAGSAWPPTSTACGGTPSASGFGRLDPIARDGRAGAATHPGSPSTPDTRGSPARARCEVDGPSRDLTADHIVVAAGSRPVVPPPVAESGLPFETSDTIMRRDRPPRRLAVLGGGYIAAELAHVFSAAGATSSWSSRRTRCSATQDETVTEEFTALAAKRFDLRLGPGGDAGGRRARRTADLARRRHGRRSRHAARRPSAGRPTGTGWTWPRRASTSTMRAGSSSTPTSAPAPRGLGARRREHAGAAQARRQPGGRRRAAQPAPPRRPGRRGARPRPIGDLHATLRSRRSARPSRTCATGGSGTGSGWPGSGTPRTGGPWRTRRGSARCSSTRPTRRSSARTSWALRPRPSCSPSCSRPRSTSRPPAARAAYWIHPALTEVVQQALIEAVS